MEIVVYKESDRVILTAAKDLHYFHFNGAVFKTGEN